MAIRPDYDIGTVTLTSGSSDFTTTGSALQTAAVQAGDAIIAPSGHILIIASITGQNSGTLFLPCPPDAAGTGLALRIRFQPDGSRYQGAVRNLIDLLSSGNIEAFAALVGAAGMVPIFTGVGTMDLADPATFGIQDPNGSLGKLAALTLAANKILNTDGSGNLTQSDITAAALALLALAGSADKFPYFTGTNTAALADLTSQARTMLASTTPAVTSLGYTPINRAGDTGITGNLKTTGKVYVGAAIPTSTPETGSPAIQAQGVAGSHSAALLYYNDANMYVLGCYKGGYGLSGGIRGDGANGVQFLTSSDYRLKYDVEPLVTFSIGEEDFEDIGPALLRVMAFRPVRHKWIGGDGEFVHGFLAHELQQAAPHAVSGVKDETAIVGVAKDEDGNIVAENIKETQCPEGATWTETGITDVYQKVDYSRVTADLTAAIQELTTIVLDQKRRLDELSS
ncbi:hypothetical protein QBD01_002337 [Ochrobactrum sp. 19YEA23]|uniref:tail fiber domain-containing protein n=1 Tax=Ochrobactrum sp. 19YEA23 TaxID=3039854 RepID=UPI0024792460|nr:hypothetical protein [Ochrobactrum sp. 19YEA23]